MNHGIVIPGLNIIKMNINIILYYYCSSLVSNTTVSVNCLHSNLHTNGVTETRDIFENTLKESWLGYSRKR